MLCYISLPLPPNAPLLPSIFSMYKKDANYQYFSQKEDFQKPEKCEVMKSGDSATTNFCDELCMFSFPSSSQLTNLSLLCSVFFVVYFISVFIKEHHEYYLFFHMSYMNFPTSFLKTIKHLE